jgi:flavorubredoxin
METQVDEIAPDIYRLSTWVPDITEHGFTFNQFLLTGDEPFLFHCGQRQLFPLVSEAINRVVPVEKLRWISFGHLEADECGAMNLLLEAAPNAEVTHGPLACMLSLIDMCDRPSRTNHSISAGTDCGSSPPRTYRTTGRRACGSTRRRLRCSPVTCSPIQVSARH